MYAITAQRYTVGPNGFTGSTQVPTFYLDPQVQGITDAIHAVAIASDVLAFTHGGSITAVNLDRPGDTHHRI